MQAGGHAGPQEAQLHQQRGGLAQEGQGSVSILRDPAKQGNVSIIAISVQDESLVKLGDSKASRRYRIRPAFRHCPTWIYDPEENTFTSKSIKEAKGPVLFAKFAIVDGGLPHKTIFVDDADQTEWGYDESRQCYLKRECTLQGHCSRYNIAIFQLCRHAPESCVGLFAREESLRPAGWRRAGREGQGGDASSSQRAHRVAHRARPGRTLRGQGPHGPRPLVPGPHELLEHRHEDRSVCRLQGECGAMAPMRLYSLSQFDLQWSPPDRCQPYFRVIYTDDIAEMPRNVAQRVKPSGRVGRLSKLTRDTPGKYVLKTCKDKERYNNVRTFVRIEAGKWF